MCSNEPSNTELLSQLLKAIQDTAQQTKDTVTKNITEYIKSENEKLTKELKIKTQQIQNLEEKCNKLEQNNLFFERHIRRNNLVIFGLTPSSDLLSTVLRFIKDDLELELTSSDVSKVILLKNNNLVKKPIKVEFVNCWKKENVLKNGFKLKGKNIQISQDLCPEDRKTKKIIHKHLKFARTKDASVKIVKGNKLLINGNLYTVKDLEQININDEDSDEVFYENEKANSAPSTPTVPSKNQDLPCTSFFEHSIPQLQQVEKLSDENIRRPDLRRKEKLTSEAKSSTPTENKKLKDYAGKTKTIQLRSNSNLNRK